MMRKNSFDSRATLMAVYDTATADSLIQAGNFLAPFCVSCSLSTTFDLDIPRLVRLLQALNAGRNACGRIWSLPPERRLPAAVVREMSSLPHDACHCCRLIAPRPRRTLSRLN